MNSLNSGQCGVHQPFVLRVGHLEVETVPDKLPRGPAPILTNRNVGLFSFRGRTFSCPVAFAAAIVTVACSWTIARPCSLGLQSILSVRTRGPLHMAEIARSAPLAVAPLGEIETDGVDLFFSWFGIKSCHGDFPVDRLNT